MSYQEKSSIVYLFTSLASLLIYGLIVYNGAINGRYDMSNLGQFWGKVILIYIPITIVVRIVVTIIFSIINAIVQEVKGEERDKIDLVDERDKLIELKTMRISLVMFAVGFVVALGYLAMGYSLHYFFFTIVLFGAVAEIGETTSKLIYYRRGV